MQKKKKKDQHQEIKGRHMYVELQSLFLFFSLCNNSKVNFIGSERKKLLSTNLKIIIDSPQFFLINEFFSI